MNRHPAAWLHGLLLVACIVFVAPVRAAEPVDAAEAQRLLERLIDGMRAGEPPAADMTERLRAAMASPDAPAFPVVMGPAQAIRFDAVSPNGNNFTFTVDHANGRMKWVVMYEQGTRRIYNLAWEQLPPFKPLPLEIGQEIANSLQHGVRGKYGPKVPVGAYRFVGREGQRICARVGSADTYMHVYLADSLEPSAPPLFSSWLPPYDDSAYPTFTPWSRFQGTSFMATLPRSGEYVLYVVAHGHAPVRSYSGGREFQRYKHNLFAEQGGTYALKLWDADAPEPPSRDKELARTQHADSAEETWMGNLAYLLQGRHVGQESAVALQFHMSGDNLVQQSVGLETGEKLRDWVYVPTGRRGEYRLQHDGRILQVQCDGNWTLTGNGAETLRFGVYGGGNQERFVQMDRLDFKPLYRYPQGTLGTSTYADTWMPLNDRNVAQVLQYLDDGRAIEAQNAANRARSAAEDAANQQRMMAGILGGFASGLAEEVADQQYAQDRFEGAVRRGQRDGLAIRRANQAADALQRMADDDAASDARDAPVAKGAGDSARDGAGAGGAEASSTSSATVVFAKGFQAPITPGATSNEMCFARVQVGPVTTGDGRPGEAKRAAADAERRFLAACRTLGALTSGDFADEWHVDAKAESAYGAWRANRWMHEVDVD
jgi:hypothetical protein